MSEANRSCKEFIPIDPTYNKTNCASCTIWGGERCSNESFVVASQGPEKTRMAAWLLW